MINRTALNPEQARAATTFDGPLLILAGAGSGKTSALTCRISNLIASGVPSREILAITFTNKAAREMRERVDALAGTSASEAWIMTFHACCARILRRDIEKLGYKRAFTIYDEDDQSAVVKDMLKRRNLDDKVYPVREIRSTLSDIKNKMISPKEWLVKGGGDQRRVTICELMVEYEKRLRDANALDFDDLLVKTLELFAEHPPVLESYQRRFRYIHVDEYQDTNAAQYQLIRLLAARSGNICVVGDDDQSIYGWRGADIRNILDFEKDFPNTQVIKLERNYRSTQTILDAANQVIAHNVSRKDKTLWTDRGDGELIVLFKALDERAEAAWVCDRMRMLKQAGVNYGDIAALYRVNAQSRVLEEMLVRAGIPYRVYGGPRFYDRKEVRDVVAYLRLLVNPADDVSLRRVINTPRRAIGDATVAELVRTATESGTSMFTSLLEPHESLASRARKSVADFGNELLDMIARAETMSVGDAVSAVVESFGLRAQYEKENTEEGRDRLANIDEFIGAAKEYGDKTEGATLEGYLENIALVTDLDSMREGPGAVTLMTLHSAKGLEFGNVFLVGLEQGLFPSNRSLQDAGRLEEERRLCYVGFTRAKDRLYLSYAEQRMLYNQTQHSFPSQFLDEVPRRLIEEAARARKAPVANPEVKTREQLASHKGLRAVPNPRETGRVGALNIPGVRKGYSPSSAQAFAEQAAAMMLFKPGDRVLHKKFGEGNVVELKGAGTDSRVLIEFAAYGVREFVASMAPIVKVTE
ncbi:MAG: UvrD-helicase domain-containing protein [Oscillospiraceae bacterium]|jgi:DNA helicase-2/ATP-dependent DNA helicase PcrA|nr:UvrD-helicase domain-containing protein [Oscillospiraceae bacterium]